MPFYIENLIFRCNGCRTEWSAEINDHMSAEQLSAWLKANLLPCPNSCGAATADVLFKLHNAKA